MSPAALMLGAILMIPGAGCRSGLLPDGVDGGLDLARPRSGDLAVASCALDKVQETFPSPSFGVGSFCDEISVCVAEQDVNAALAAAPALRCDPGAICPFGRSRCVWESAPLDIDADELEQLCRLSVISSVKEITCLIFG